MGHRKGSPERKVYSHECIFKKTERSQISDLIVHHKLLEKQQKANPKINRRREIIKIRAEINEIVTKKSIQRINETKRWFFEKTNKIDRLMANMTKMRREKIQISKIRNAKGEIIKNTMEAQEMEAHEETTSITYILINMEILKKWIDFWILTIIQNRTNRTLMT
jgi:hypothetical protein